MGYNNVEIIFFNKSIKISIIYEIYIFYDILIMSKFDNLYFNNICLYVSLIKFYNNYITIIK